MTHKVDKFYGQLTCGLVAAAVLAIGSFWIRGLSTGLERFVFDRTQRATPAQLSKDVVVVGIDADSKSHLGEWPWPNSLHAQLIDELRAVGSKTVVFTAPPAGTRSANLDRVRAAMAILQSSDIANSGRAEELRRLLSGSVENLDDDQQLIRAMQGHGQVLLPIETSIENQGTDGGAGALSLPAWPSIDQDVMAEAPTARVVSAPSPDLLAAAKGAGHLLSPPDTDEVIRSTLTGVKIDGEHLLPSLAVLAAASATNRSDKLHYSNDSLDFGSAETERRLDRELSIMTRNFPADGAGAVPGYSYWQVLAGNAPAAEFKDKIVVVGFTDGANADRVVTPLSSMTPRALLVAGTIQSLINDDVYRRPVWSIALQILASLGVIAAAALGLPSLGLGLGALLSVAVVGLLLGAEVSLLAHAGIWLQLTLPCLAMLFAYGAYASGLRWPTPKFTSEKLTTNPDGLRTLALTLQGQGQLDLAYETFRRCPMDPTTLDLLYRLGADFERRRQLTKAADIYAHIVSIDANYRDARQKSERYASEQTPKEPAAPPAAAKPKPSAPTSKSSEEKPSSGAPAQARAKETPAKETLGRYEIERQLGKGAMGVVYLGRDPKINRVVAIKAIPLAEEFEDSDLADVRERFFREAEMAGCLNHPGIVTVYDAGEDRGLAYIAMELLRGEHLSFYAEPQNLLPSRKVLTLAARLADALDYAHRQNVIHRDIKPANIMFNVETDTLKITDFGIARLTDASRTKTGIVLGTPSFMSPEQLEGRSIDGRSDLFALGVTLYQLLSAQLPFRADSMTRLMNKIATEPHTPIRSIRPELPAALETVLDRALAKAADNRYQTGADMAEALRSCLRAIES